MPQLHPQAQGSSRFRLCGIRDSAYVEMEVPPTAVLIDWLVSGRITDGVLLEPQECPVTRLLLGYQAGYGISLLCIQEIHDLFLCAESEMGPPIVHVFIPPDTHERWPADLFVPAHIAAAAVDYALRYGQPHPSLHWIGAGDFPRGERCGRDYAPNR
jgi:hypothetical protein